MTEWWTYRLHSFLMFSWKTYARTVESYNADTWPAHVLAVLGGFAVLLLVDRGSAPRVLAALLAVAWAWVAWAFLWQRYSPIFLGGPWLAAAFGVQAVALTHAAWRGNGRLPAVDARMRSSAGSMLVWFGLLAFPAFTAAGHPPRVQLFGMMPDPTALVTLGALIGGALPVHGRWRRLLAVVPALAVLAGALTWWALLE
jgi:hypothetical protein